MDRPRPPAAAAAMARRCRAPGGHGRDPAGSAAPGTGQRRARLAGLLAAQLAVGDTIGWPQLTRAVAAQRAALERAGQPPTSIFTGYYAEAAALDVLGPADHLPPVLSGHNAYWMWGPGQASDRTVLVVDALGQLRPYFASWRLLTTYDAPYHVENNWTGVPIGICTGPAASWRALWPNLRHYG
jgi:hypothetical protein